MRSNTEHRRAAQALYPRLTRGFEGGKIFDRWDEVYPVMKKVVGAMIALMVLCVLLFGFLQYRNGSRG